MKTYIWLSRYFKFLDFKPHWVAKLHDQILSLILQSFSAQIYLLVFIRIGPYSRVFRSWLFRSGDSRFQINHLSTLIKIVFLTIGMTVVTFDLVLSNVKTIPSVVFDSGNFYLPSFWLIILSPQTFFLFYSDLQMLFASFNRIILLQLELYSVWGLLYLCSASLLQAATSILTSLSLTVALVKAFHVITTLVGWTTAAQVWLTKLLILSL